MPCAPRTCFRFGQFEIDAHARVLRKGGVKIRLQEQPFQVLLALLEAPGEIVTREQLRQRLWPEGTFVEFDHALNTAVKKIRAALCDRASGPRYVETIPRRGYRFLALVDTTDLQPVEHESAGSGFRLPLRRVRWATAAITSALAMALLLYAAERVAQVHSEDTATLAVLPFSDMNTNSSQNSLNSGLSKLLAEQLQRAHPKHLIVSAHALKADATSLNTNVRQGRIDYVLQGGVLRDEQRVRVAVQLVRISDQDYLWTEDFERPWNGPAMEGELAAEIVRRLQPTLALLDRGSR
jgi:DNA-binding winged helix-turn-helix (wHTH) protein/TolB-like protein